VLWWANVLERLLECKAPPNVQTKRGRSPIHRACANGHSAVVELLLAAKADGDRHIPLHIARSKGHMAMAGMLVGAKAQENVQNANGVTPLQAAPDAGYEELVQFLSQDAFMRQSAARVCLIEAARLSNSNG
jgi:ankyrin repeat protein